LCSLKRISFVDPLKTESTGTSCFPSKRRRRFRWSVSTLRKYKPKSISKNVSRYVLAAFAVASTFAFADCFRVCHTWSLSGSASSSESISARAALAALRSPGVSQYRSTKSRAPSAKRETPIKRPIPMQIFHDVLLLQISICKSSRTFTSKPHCAAAPLTISMISLVMAAWRTRFMCSVSASIISEALLVAASIAVMRAACSAATDSVMA
jgi:hypothetical protein